MKPKIGTRFGKRVVIGNGAPQHGRHANVTCRCDCGRVDIVEYRYLLSDKSAQCKSCHMNEMRAMVSHPTGHNSPAFIHGRSATPEWRAWKGMFTRCYNPNTKTWACYGGRGIEVCKKWRASFMEFYKHVGDRPSPNHSLDRIDNNGNYEPGNVRWATSKEQAANRRKRGTCRVEGLGTNG